MKTVDYVDLERYRFRSSKPKGERILVARSLEPMYDVGTAIEAFQRVRRRFPAAELLVAGTGSRQASLETRVRVEEIQGVTFLGRVENESMPALLGRADVVLNPSRVDNMPISIPTKYRSFTLFISNSTDG